MLFLLRRVRHALYKNPVLPYDEQQLRRFADSIEEMRCYQALLEIKAILEDDTLEDAECFTKIEEIICVLERYGSGGGTRHDFG